jgi:hypothetical protein
MRFRSSWKSSPTSRISEFRVPAGQSYSYRREPRPAGSAKRYMALCTGLVMSIMGTGGCGGPDTTSKSTTSVAAPTSAPEVKTASGKSKSKLKNVDPLGELGVRELRALKKAQKTQ